MIESTFHEAIRSGEVAARLIYADWLEEQGRLVESAMIRSGRWCLIPAGTFWMGGGGGTPGEKQVEILQSFYLGAFPVTQGEWQAVMGANPSYFSRVGEAKERVRAISDQNLLQFPVENVTWQNIQIYLKRLNESEPDSGWIFCLPSEDQWEYACRGAALTVVESSFDFYLDNATNSLSNQEANISQGFLKSHGSSGPSLKRTSRVGSYRPNRLGLYDMHGNICEWCEDPTIREPLRKPMRGGSWYDPASNCRAGYRHRNRLGVPYSPILGFRVVRIRSRAGVSS